MKKEKNEFKDIFQTLKMIYNRYLYFIIKPVIVILALILIFKVLGFIFYNVGHALHFVITLSFPFLLGIIISFLLEPIHQFLQKRFKIPRVIAVILTLLVTMIIIFTFLSVILYIAIIQLSEATNDLIQTMSGLDYKLIESNITTYLQHSFLSNYITPEQVSQWSLDIRQYLNNITHNLASSLSVIGRVLGNLTSKVFIHVIPKIFIITFISLFTSFFVSKDKSKIANLIYEYTPHKVYGGLIKIKNEILKNIFKYIKAHFILVGIASVILLIGFLIVGTPYAIAFFFLCLLLNNVPLIGASLLIVPWSIYALCNGDTSTCVILLVFLLLSSAVRHAIEPKILGDSLGFHPLLLLVALYIGAEIFGGIGIILGPFILIFIKVLIDTKMINFSKVKKEEEVQ